MTSFTHLQHWNLQTDPFAGSVPRGSLHASRHHEEALARLQYVLEAGHRLAALVGESGSGKSLLLRTFADSARQGSVCVGLVSLLGTSPQELLRNLLLELEVVPHRGSDIPELWRRLQDRIRELVYLGLGTVVLCDDVASATPETLSHVARLTKVILPADRDLNVVLAGCPEMYDRLPRSLSEAISLRMELSNWDPSEVEVYLREALHAVGREEPVFNAEAIDKLSTLSRGIPRRVRQLAELSLIAGAGNGMTQIDAHTVESSFLELAAPLFV